MHWDNNQPSVNWIRSRIRMMHKDQLTVVCLLCDYHLSHRRLLSRLGSFSKSWIWNEDFSRKCFPHQLKCSAFTALLPTVPRTYRRCERIFTWRLWLWKRWSCPALSSTDEDKQLVGPKSETQFHKDLGEKYLSDIDKEEGADIVDLSSTAPLLYRNLWSSHIQRLVIGWHLLRYRIASLNCSLLQLHLLALLSFLRLPRPASPPKTRTDSRKASNGRVFRLSQMHLNNPFGMAPLLCVSPRTPDNTHYEKPTVTYFLWIRVNLTYLSQLRCASRVSECALQLQGKPAPYACFHISPSHWVPRLFSWHGLQTYRLLSQRAERKIFRMYKRGNNGWCKYLKGFETEPSEDKGCYWRWQKRISVTGRGSWERSVDYV